MVLTKSELIGSLQNEVRILQHLCTKIEPSMLDYRPTPGQRSTIEWLKYLAVVGPVCVKSALAGGFDQALWIERSGALADKDFAGTVAAIAALPDEYAKLLGGVPDEAFRKDVEMFGHKSSVGAFMVNTVLGAYAAYRTQIFCYLKACGRTELSTMNLWAGMDPVPAPAG
jgi:hypothetical protein